MYTILRLIVMEYENTKIINIEGLINIQGKWIEKGQLKHYDGIVIYAEPLFSIRFTEYADKKIEWLKSERRIDFPTKFYINLYNYNKELPFVYNGDVELGKIFLLVEFKSHTKRYEVYIQCQQVKPFS